MSRRVLAAFSILAVVLLLTGCDGEGCGDPHTHSYDAVSFKCDCGAVDPNHPHEFFLTYDKLSHWNECPYCGEVENGSVSLHDYDDFLVGDESRECSFCHSVADDGFLSSLSSVLGSCRSFFSTCRALFKSFPLVFRVVVYFIFGAILVIAIQRLLRKVGK